MQYRINVTNEKSQIRATTCVFKVCFFGVIEPKYACTHKTRTHTHTDTHTHRHTHRQVSTGELVDDDTHPYPCPRLIACSNTYFSFMFTGAFPLHAAALHATCVLISKSLLSRDGRMVDCTVKHPGVERPFSSYSLKPCTWSVSF